MQSNAKYTALTRAMGLLLFLVGFALILLAILVILDILSVLGTIQRWLVFASGTVVCIIGYLMGRGTEPLESPPTIPPPPHRTRTDEPSRPIGKTIK